MCGSATRVQAASDSAPFCAAQVYGVYLIFAFFNLVAVVFCVTYVFETKGLTKAEIKAALLHSE